MLRGLKVVLWMCGGTYKVRNCFPKTYTRVLLLYLLTWSLLLLYSFPLFLHTSGANHPLISWTWETGRSPWFHSNNWKHQYYQHSSRTKSKTAVTGRKINSVPAETRTPTFSISNVGSAGRGKKNFQAISKDTGRIYYSHCNLIENLLTWAELIKYYYVPPFCGS